MGETDKVMQALRDGGHRPVLDVDAITTGPSVPGWRLVIGAQGPSAAGRRASGSRGREAGHHGVVPAPDRAAAQVADSSD